MMKELPRVRGIYAECKSLDDVVAVSRKFGNYRRTVRRGVYADCTSLAEVVTVSHSKSIRRRVREEWSKHHADS